MPKTPPQTTPTLAKTATGNSKLPHHPQRRQSAIPTDKMRNDLQTNFAKLLDAANGGKFAVVGHMRPDGDCVAAQFATSELLRSRGASKVVCLNQNKIPHLYETLADGLEFTDAETFADTSFKIVLVDCSDLARANNALKEKFPEVFACIDHHASGKSTAQINIVDVEAGATAEIIALAVGGLGLEISRQTANLLFTGLATDTRQFTTTSTRKESFEAAQILVNAGATPNAVAQELYQRERPAKMRLLSQYLSGLKFYCGNKVCFGFIPLGTFEKLGANKEDTEGLVDFARSIDGVQIAATLEELADGSVKGSMRGRLPNYEVNKIAEAFGGGGHLAAAGFTAKNETMQTIVPKLIGLCEKSLEK